MNKIKNNGFKFKSFFVTHEKSPMKVTTDSCLLGAWAPIPNHVSFVLDVGCGCGILSLMLAQRLKQNVKVLIDAIDIDQNAITECIQNKTDAGFSNINAKCIDFNEFCMEYARKYQLIISNPPYFIESMPNQHDARANARSTHLLSHKSLIKNVKNNLDDDGYFCVVLPYAVSPEFIETCHKNQLYLINILRVKDQKDKPYKLVLLCFSHQQNKKVITKDLILKDDDGVYSSDFIELLNDFYLFDKPIYQNKKGH